MALAAVWCIGWLGCTLYLLLFGFGSEDKKQAWQNRFLGDLFMSVFLWPALWPEARRLRKFERDFPQWVVYADGECGDGEWILSNGTAVSASVVPTPDRPVLVEVHCEGGVLPETVECRTRKIAPEEGQPSAWRRLRLKQPEPDPEDEVPDNEPFYEASLELSRGKYRADFRIRLKAMEPEECGGLTLIVAG